MSDALWDHEIEQAWSDLQQSLEQALTQLQVDDSLLLEVDGPLAEVHPYVQVLRSADDYLLEASSNNFLTGTRRLDKPARKCLRAMGFNKPTEDMPNYWVSLQDSATVARTATRALRESLRVLHPSFLNDADFPWITPAPDVSITRPTGQQHLKELVDQTLAQILGHTPHFDEDGDIPIRAGQSLVYALVDANVPLIRLLCVIVSDISSEAVAQREAGHMNQTVSGMKFTAHQGHILATADLMASPFVPDHLLAVVPQFCKLIAEHDVALAERTGGTTLCGDHCAPETDGDHVHPAMLQLLQLAADGQLSPKLAAKVCGYDSDLIVQFITWNSRQEIAWRQARDEAEAEADFEEAEVCEIERASAEEAVRVLRKALRKVLER